MDNELTFNSIVVFSNEERNLKNVIHQISQTGKPVFEITFTKALFNK
jgi:hypothetical protein